MNVKHLALGLSIAATAVAPAAFADALYATANMAQASCGADQVVFIDLDRGRYYKPGTEAFGKSSNGIYSCEKSAHAKYREGKSDATAVATK
jgi:hypothetical protein